MFAYLLFRADCLPITILCYTPVYGFVYCQIQADFQRLCPYGDVAEKYADLLLKLKKFFEVADVEQVTGHTFQWSARNCEEQSIFSLCYY